MPSCLERLRAIQRITDGALVHLDLDAMLHELLARLRRALDSDNTLVMLVYEERPVLYPRAMDGKFRERVAQVRIPMGQGVSGRVAQTGQPVIVNDLSTVDFVSRIEGDPPCGVLEVVQSSMVAPLPDRGKQRACDMSGILVIEDDPSLRAVIVEILRDQGLEVAWAENGQAGLSVASAMAPDLVLCDIKMAGVDGYAVLRALRRDPFTAVTPVIFLTGMGGPEAVRAGMNLGADDYLVKPVTARALIEAVTARLERSATVRAEAGRQLTTLRGDLARSLLPHEFLTPLTAVIGLGSLLTEDDAVRRDDVKEVARGIVDAGQALESLITKFLHYAELQAPLAERVASLEPTKAWDALVAEAKDRAGRAGRLTDLELSGEPASVPLTVDHWRMLVRELADNALKFSEAGSRIGVALASITTGTQLTVRDQGRGMSDEQIAALQNRAPFLRRHQHQAGLGLGLSIVQRLLELHRGGLTFETASAKGTLVRVLFRRT